MATEFINGQWRIPNSWNVDESNQGKISNYSMEFDGISDSIAIPSYTIPENSTVSFWVKSSLTNPQDIIISGAAGHYYPYLLLSGGNIKLIIKAGGTSNELITDVAWVADTWFHIAITGENGQGAGSTATYYINGVSKGTSLNRTPTLTVIGNYTTSSLAWNGQIDQVTFFDYALPATGTNSVATLYGNNSAGYFQIGNPMALTPNPVVFYPLGDQDLIGAGYNGANYLVPNNSTSGYSPYAIEINGIDNNFTIDNSSEDLNVEYLTASIWFKPDVAEFATLIGNRYFNNGYMSWAVQTFADGTIRYIQQTPGAGSAFTSDDTYNVGQWNHVAVTYDSVGGAKIYLNGGAPKELTSITSPIQYNTGFISNNVTIGSAAAGGSTASPTGPTQHFDGQLSNVAVWNSGLSSSQIATIYNNGIPGDISSLNPLAWWELGSMMGFNGSDTYTALSNTDSNFAAVSTSNMASVDVVNGPGYSNGGSGTSSLVIGKQAPYSFNNALSESMAISNRDDSQITDPYPLMLQLDLSDETGSYVYSGAVVSTSAVYPYTVDWGDGNVESITSSAQLVSNRLNHTYNADEYPKPVVQIGRSSDVGGIRQFSIANGGSDLKLVDVKQFGKNTLDIFNIYGASLCRVTATDNLIITTSLKDAFRNTRANPVSINSWDVSTVTDVQYLASSNDYFNQDLNNWDTSSINSTLRMFFYNAVFNGDMSNWYRPATVTTLFHLARDFNQDISTKYISAANSPSGSEYIAWDMDGVTTMASMLYQANDFDQDISNWNTSSVTNMNDAFRGNKLNADLSTNQVTIGAGTSVEKTYTAWDVKNVTSFYLMFEGCSQLNQTFYDWELSSNLTSMNRMFRSCGSMSTANYANNWGIFANSVMDDNSGSGGAASGRPKDVYAQQQGLTTPALSVGHTCPVSSGGTQHFTTVGRAMSYLTSDVQITFIEEEEEAVQLYTADFLQTPGSDFPTKLVGVTAPNFTFEWSGSVWEFKKSGVTLDTDTGSATLQQGPEDGTWNILTVVTANQNWNYGRLTDTGDTYKA